MTGQLIYARAEKYDFRAQIGQKMGKTRGLLKKCPWKVEYFRKKWRLSTVNIIDSIWEQEFVIIVALFTLNLDLDPNLAWKTLFLTKIIFDLHFGLEKGQI